MENVRPDKFCKYCGTIFPEEVINNSQSGHFSSLAESAQQIFLNAENLTYIHELFFHARYGGLLNKSAEFDSIKVKTDLENSMDNIANYIIGFMPETQTEQIDFVREAIGRFLRENVPNFYRTLETLDGLKKKASSKGINLGMDMSCSAVICGGGCIGAIVGAIIFGLGGIASGAGWGIVGYFILGCLLLLISYLSFNNINHSKKDFEEQLQKVNKIYDELWESFRHFLLNDIAQNTDINFQIDWRKYEQLLEFYRKKGE
jgi:hypothetical protein